MGIMHVEVGIRNPMEPGRVWEGKFLVDTGAMDTLVPKQYLESIGLKPKSHRSYGLADGRERRLGIAGARIEFMGDFTWGTVVFGDEDAEPLLGVTALESVGIEVDLHNHTMKKLPAVRMRGGFRARWG